MAAMARIELGGLFSGKSPRTLAAGSSIAPYASLRVLFAPAVYWVGQFECLRLWVGLGVVAAASLYVLLVPVHELRLLGTRLTF